MRFTLDAILLLIVMSVLGCAPPAPDYADQSFIPHRDVLAAALYNEGQNLLRSGRYVDAEMRFRKAAYLYPDAENIQSQLALTLKSAGLFDESISIYRGLVTRNPKMIDYQYALADAFYKAEKYDLAVQEFEKVRLAYEAKNDSVKAASTARSQAAIYFELGREAEALCASKSAYSYTPVQGEILRHARLLIALGYLKEADLMLAPYIADPTVAVDIMYLKLASFAKFGLGDMESYSKLVTRADEARASGAVLDGEIQVMLLVSPKEVSSETEETGEEQPLPFLADGVMVYWPPSLIEKWNSIQSERAKIL